MGRGIVVFLALLIMFATILPTVSAYPALMVIDYQVIPKEKRLEVFLGGEPFINITLPYAGEWRHGIRNLYIWGNTYVRIIDNRPLHGLIIKIRANETHIEPASNRTSMSIIFPGMAVIARDGHVYGLVSGKIKHLSTGGIVARGEVKIHISPISLKDFIKKASRYRFSWYNVNGTFEGRWIKGELRDGHIYNFTVRDEAYIHEIDLSDIITPNYRVIQHGAVIFITSEKAQVMIMDNKAGLILVKPKENSKITIDFGRPVTVEKCGDENKTILAVKDNIELGNVFLIKGYNVTYSVSETTIVITARGGLISIMSPPVYRHMLQYTEAYVKVYDNGTKGAEGLSLRPDISVNVTPMEDRVRIDVSGEGEGTIVAVELDPSLNITVEKLYGIKVNFDGKEIGYTDNIINATEAAYTTMVDEEGVILFVKVPHFSEHTIEVLLEQSSGEEEEGQGIPSAPDTPQAPTPTPEKTPIEDIEQESQGEESDNMGILMGAVIAIIAAIALVALLVMKRE